MEPAVTLRGVTKRFGGQPAVDGLDLEVDTGSCVGLLGPNGAGKTTTMRLLTAQAIADSGEITVLGCAMPEQSKQVRAACGVVPQQDNLDQELTARQNLAVFARLYRVPSRDRSAAVDRALEQAGLTERAQSKVGALSGGMRRRLLIARGLIHEPRLALLDEPTIGLDPQVRQELWSLIDDMRNGGVTVLMSTHYIEEAERLADTVAIMVMGRIVARGRPADLIAEHAGREAVQVYGSPAHLAAVDEHARSEGLPTRRTGAALVVMGIERVGTAPEGDLRPTNLEDVYVLLTAEPPA